MKKKIFLIIIIVILSSCNQNKKNDNFVQGFLDISQNTSEIYKLDRSWYFWPNELLSYNEVAYQIEHGYSMFINTPYKWQKLGLIEPSHNLMNTGTIALRVNFPKANELWAIELPNADSSTSLYLNRDLLTQIGKTSVNKADSIPSNKLVVKNFTPKPGENLIIIHVSSFYAPYIGIWDSPVLGKDDDIQKKRMWEIIISSLISGALIFMGFYHIALYILRTNDKTTLIFGTICIFMAIRNLITGERILLELMPESLLSWRIAFNIEHLSAHMTLPLFFLYFKRIFNTYINTFIERIIIAVALLWLVLQIFTPVMFHQRFLSLYEYFLLTSALYLLFRIFAAAQNRVEGAKTTLFGIAILIGTVFNDVLLSNEVISGFYMSPLGVFVYTFSQSFLLSKRFSNLFFQVENYSYELENLNSSLQRFIPQEVLKYLDKKSIIDVELGDYSEEEMSVMFLDIRDFTSLSESMSPNDNFRFINSFLKRVGPLIRRNGGFVDKYIGDGIMALFPGEPDNALKATLHIRKALNILNKERIGHGLNPIKIGMGVNTGKLMLGTIGEDQRMDSTVISDAVNTASRLESLTKKFNVDILVSDTTIDNLTQKDKFIITYIGDELLRGKSKNVKIYTVEWADSKGIFL